MIKQLRITNLILIETTEIEFSEGFNVLSGETGSGKSAVMHAINLITGDRADSSIVRKGTEKGVVEVIFDHKVRSLVEDVLAQAGIDFEEGDDLYIKREISAAGKSRAWINHQLSHLSLLRSVCARLINSVGQHANQDLASLERHRAILDVFGGLGEKVATFGKGWEKENHIQKELELLISSEAQRIRESENCQMILEELEEAALKEGEDEELFTEYTLLAHAEEIGGKVQSIYSVLKGEKSAVLPLLNRQKGLLEGLAGMDSSLLNLFQSFHNAVLEIQEVADTLNLYHSRIENNPARLTEINDRLSLITRLKKKYGSSLEEINIFSAKNKQRLAELQNTDNRIENLQIELKIVKDKNHQAALQLTQYRREVALKLSSALKQELTSLNMPNVDFNIDVSPQKRNRWGDDCIEFFLLPNVGEHRVSIKDCASGGELSRVMLALQTLLSGKEAIPIIVFDEIDANIGGETAKIVGKKLKTMGEQQQVLCVTHFPQVAKYADHHLQISKCVSGERTLTIIQALNQSNREKEMARMAGL